MVEIKVSRLGGTQKHTNTKWKNTKKVVMPYTRKEKSVLEQNKQCYEILPLNLNYRLRKLSKKSATLKVKAKIHARK